jgi:hypothetical protein
MSGHNRRVDMWDEAGIAGACFLAAASIILLKLIMQWFSA